MIDLRPILPIGVVSVPIVGIPVQHIARAGFDWIALVELAIMALVAIVALLKKRKKSK